MGEERKVYKVLVGKPKGKRPLGRPRRRWEDGVRMEGQVADSTGEWRKLENEELHILFSSSNIIRQIK
jgi:hypothetical protein